MRPEKTEEIQKMHNSLKKAIGDKNLCRRIFLKNGLSILGVFLSFKKKAYAQEKNSIPHPQLSYEDGNLYSPQFYSELDKILNGVQPKKDSSFKLELPEYAENGSMVPFKITLGSPMTSTNYVRSFHLLSTFNPNPWVANFNLTPLCGKAQVLGRMRLAKSQNVFALAQHNNGQFLITHQHVEVLRGGCGMD